MNTLEKISKNNPLNLLICFFPISCFLGNLFINANLVLICFLGLYHYRGYLNLSKNLILLFSFFLFIILTTFLNYTLFGKNYGYENHLNFEDVLKSILFLRFFFLSIVIYLTVKYQHFDFKLFCLVCLISLSFIIVDIIFQSFYGKNFFGYPSGSVHNSGIFKDEYVAGGYIIKFSLFAIIYPLMVLSKNTKKIPISLIFIITFVFLGIMFSGNKIPLMMFIISLFLLILFLKEQRMIVLTSMILCFVMFSLNYNSNSNFKDYYDSFYHKLKFMPVQLVKNIFKEKIETSSLNEEKVAPVTNVHNHNQLILTSLRVWQENILIGNGIKSFRKKCATYTAENTKDSPTYNCSTHPHNYYFEILAELGIIGLSMFIIIFYLFILEKFLSILRNKEKNNIALFSVIIFITLISEIFPLRSTGSFFSTANAATIFFFLGFFLHKKED